MKTIMLILMAGLLLVGANAFADDVSIDQDGNLTTGSSNSDANLEVTGTSGEHGIVGETSGTAAGVYGVNTTNSNYGILGYDSYGVYGYSSLGYAGYFEGDTHITGNLTVGGSIGYTETDPQVNSLINGRWCTSDGSSVNCTAVAPVTSEADPIFSTHDASGVTSGLLSNWNTAYGWGDHSTAGYDTTNDSWTGTGDVYTMSGNVGIGTSSPSHSLHINNSADSEMFRLEGPGAQGYLGKINFGDGDYVYLIEDKNDKLKIYAGQRILLDSERITLNADNVGIGTSSPSEKLTVAGTIESTSGGIKFPDGSVQATAAVSYVRTVVVSPVPGDETASGTALRNAIDGITDASETNPYLVKIEPGIYNIGTTNLQMKSHVDIEGSGENTTKIIGTLSMHLKHDMELRFLTIENINGGFALSCTNTVEFSLLHVTVTSSGGAFFFEESRVVVSNATVVSEGGTGANASHSDLEMNNVTVTASGASDNRAIYFGYGTVNLSNVTATASGGNNTIAIHNPVPSVFTMTNVTATASGGAVSNKAIESTVSFEATSLTAVATGGGGTTNYGIYYALSMYVSSANLSNITATSSGGSTNYGIYFYADEPPASLKINSSVISGSTNSVYTFNGLTTYIGHTYLGGPVGGGTTICAGVTDSNYTFYASTCP